MTLAEFGSWALAQGSVGNPDGKNSFKGQCVSLIQQYLYRVFGKSFAAYGNAKDWAYNYPRAYFKSVGTGAKLQPGDVLVYGSNYGRGYGHIAMIDVNGKFFDQNGIKSLRVAYQNTPWRGYVAVLRPIDQSKLKPTSKYVLGKYVVNTKAGLNVRKSPKTGAVVKTYPNGTRFDTYEIRDNWARTPSRMVLPRLL